MSDEQQPQDDSVAEEFRNLGKNLTGVLRSAWDRPERRKVQEDLESGLNNLGSSIKKEMDALRENPAARKMGDEVADFAGKVRAGEAEAKVREEVRQVLRSANSALEQIIRRWASAAGAESAEEGASTDAEPAPAEAAAEPAPEPAQDAPPAEPSEPAPTGGAE